MTSDRSESPAERAFRAIADADPADGVDLADDELPVAATVVLLRDAAAGAEVLLLERPDRGSFAGAWVFPGGKLEDADRLDGATEEESARLAGVRETEEEVGLALHPAALTTLACWSPPARLPLRIRTWFFVAVAPSTPLRPEPGEVVATQWIRAAEMLARHAAGEVTLYPPTWVTLRVLAGVTDADPAVVETVDEVLARVHRRGRRDYPSRLHRHPDGVVFLWPGDAEYDGVDGAARHRLDTRTLPWSYDAPD